MKTERSTLVKLISEFEPEYALLTSFTLDLMTFERLILPHMQKAQILIIADRHGYQTAVMAGPAAREAGVRYRVVQVERPYYAFHPKITLLTKPGQMRLIAYPIPKLSLLINKKQMLPTYRLSF